MVQFTAGAALRAVILAGVLLNVMGGAQANSWSSRLEEDFDLRKRHVFSCKNENDACRGVPKCCGDLQCYWEDGYSPFRAGKCVMCIEDGLSCQRDSGCCGGLQCDKLDFVSMNGKCKAPRTKGACYRNAQCLYGCERAYYKGQGTCYSSPPPKA